MRLAPAAFICCALLAGCYTGNELLPPSAVTVAPAPEQIDAAVAAGALVFDSWTSTASGGSGVLPAGEPEEGYVRCVACHGWDLLGEAGGYVRRTRSATQANTGDGDTLNTATRNIATGALGRLATITAAQIAHSGARRWNEGSAIWDGSPEAYAKGNEHPDFTQAGGLTPTQIDNLAAFLNSEWTRADKVFAHIDTTVTPVDYTLVAAADATRGASFYQNNCTACHGTPDSDSTAFSDFKPGAGGLYVFLQGDGAPSKFMHVTHWGIPGSTMTRAAMGSPTAVDVADVLKYLDTFAPPLVGDVARGLQLWTGNNCLGCHNSLGIPNPQRVTNYMGTVDGQMDNFVFTDQEVADLKAYLWTVY